MRRLLILLLFLGAALFAGPAHAHSSLIDATPPDGAVLATAPQQVTLTFNEPVSPTVLKLIAPDGAAPALGAATLSGNTVTVPLPAGLGKGSYGLSWRALSADGHPVGGTLVFSIGAPTGGPLIAASASTDQSVQIGIWLSRLLVYGGLFIGVGGAFFRRWTDSAPGQRAIAVALAVGLIALLPNTGFEGLDDLGQSLGALLTLPPWAQGMQSSHGTFVVLAALALLIGFAALYWRGRPGLWLGLVGLAALGAGFAATGHAGTADPQWLTRPAVFLHTVTVAFWIGALLPLAAALAQDAAAARTPLRQFSATIPWTTALLVACGVGLAVLQLASPGEVLTTDYGRVLIAKLVLVAVLLGIAAHNRWRLTTPALAGRTAATRGLGRASRIELVLAIAIFGVVGLWRFTPPPRALLEATAAAVPAEAVMFADDGMAAVTLTPGRAGPVQVAVDLMVHGDEPARTVTLNFSSTEKGIEPFQRPATLGADGLWHADQVILPVAGVWQVGVDVLITDFKMLRLKGDVTLP